VHKLGAAVSTANPGYGSSELAYQLKDCDATALITSTALLPTALKAIEECWSISPSRVFLMDGKTHKTQKTIEELIRIGRSSKKPLAPLKLAKGDSKRRLAFICYSSGTTGLPKGVMISHYNIIANVLQITLLFKNFDANKRDTTLCMLPLYHIYGKFLVDGLISGLVWVLHAELYIGNTLIVVPAFEFSSFLSYIQKYRMTKLFLVPPIVVRLVKDSLTRKYDLSSLEQITCGAAPLGSDPTIQMRSKFKGIIFKQGIFNPIA